MTKDQLLGILDRILIAVATYATARGWITSDQAAQYVPLVIAIAGAIYGWYINRPNSIISSASALPQVEKVVAPSVATTTFAANDKVTTQ